MKYPDDTTLIIPALPPSSNVAIRMSNQHGYTFGYKSVTLKRWMNDVRAAALQNRPRIATSPLYGIEITYSYPKYSKNGNLKRKDLDNLIKYTIDEFIKYVITPDEVSIDDSQIDEINAVRVDSQVLQTKITLYKIG